jgi:hypothetical protein
MIDLASGQAEALAIAVIMGVLAAAILVICFGADLIETIVEGVHFGHDDNPDNESGE